MPSLLGISVVLFTVLALAPGDPFAELALNPNVPPEVQANLRDSSSASTIRLAALLPLADGHAAGRLGLFVHQPGRRRQLIMQRVPITLAVIGASQLLALAIALPVGILSAARPYSLFDRIASTLAFDRLLAADLLHRPAVHPDLLIKLDWLPFVYRADIARRGWEWWWQNIRQSIMPITVLGLFQGASWTRYVRSAMLDVIRLDYVTTARARACASAR